MKALILGAGGQLGRALRKTLPKEWNAAALARHALDIVDDAALAAALEATRPDLVVNAAAYTHVDAAERQEAAAFRVNCEGAAAVAHACSAHDAKLVHLSTDYVFDGQDDGPIGPEAPTNPINAYGRSKQAGEHPVLAASGNLLVRTSWLYGAHRRNFATLILDRMTDAGPVRVVADQTGVPTHVNSLARAIWILAEHDATGIHHFTDRGSATWYDFARTIADKARSAGVRPAGAIDPVATADYPSPASRPRSSVLDCTATWPITGTPRHWEEELDIMLAEWMAAR
ncbi:dTDP-4-dehydrorhamnose reductase [Parasphingopyxis algicola]|uniref:dTDP-4-dehydrorhamnose reductase n=1 Tax=Parasphingopyxis algicola TaxID=2026624 RepID=UPI0015A0351A|nr:dTDP-4-dehydrorhamnose reductase [Parasphingopyxis algicola]QLC24021.1 dTDP-4-dehydrorhamnose reductase [Parasphingopyxis algicola]